ncbi:MAG: transporter [Deltaproteobacteria bacterium]|nr:transporter [Deltaproteobacteria bacterium]
MKTLAIALLLLLPTTVFAGSPSFSVFRTPPSLGGAHYFSLSEGQPLKRGELQVLNFWSYQHRPLSIVSRAGIATDVIDGMVATHFGVHFGMVDAWSVGVDLPIAVWERFTQVGDTQASNTYGLGDLLLRTNINLRRGAFAFALQPLITIPTNNGALYLGANRLTFGGDAVIEYLPSAQFSAAFNLGYHALPDVTIGDAHSDDELRLGLGMSYLVADPWRIFIETTGRATLDEFGKNRHSMVDVMAGFHVPIAHHFQWTTAIGRSFLNGVGSPEIHGVTGIRLTMSMVKEKSKPQEITLPPPRPHPSGPPRKPVPRRFLPIR